MKAKHEELDLTAWASIFAQAQLVGLAFLQERDKNPTEKGREMARALVDSAVETNVTALEVLTRHLLKNDGKLARHLLKGMLAAADSQNQEG